MSERGGRLICYSLRSKNSLNFCLKPWVWPPVPAPFFWNSFERLFEQASLPVSNCLRDRYVKVNELVSSPVPIRLGHAETFEPEYLLRGRAGGTLSPTSPSRVGTLISPPRHRTGKLTSVWT